MKTENVSIENLNPGDKIYQPGGGKLPDILTVKTIEVARKIVTIEETGGLHLEGETNFKRVIPENEPSKDKNDQFTMFSLVFLLLFPALVSAQFAPRESYTFLSAGFDPKIAIYGTEDLHGPAYDGTFSLGFRWTGVQIEFTYETFKEIGFQSGQLQAGYFWRNDKQFQIGLLPGVSLIHREVSWKPQVLEPAVSLTGRLEFHFSKILFVFSELESRVRGDLSDKVVHSGYGGVGVKF